MSITNREIHCDHKHVYKVMKPEHDNTSKQTIYISCHTRSHLCIRKKIFAEEVSIEEVLCLHH